MKVNLILITFTEKLSLKILTLQLLIYRMLAILRKSRNALVSFHSYCKEFEKKCFCF